MRRLRALAALDPEVEGVIARRDERRRDALEAIVGPLFADTAAKPSTDAAQLVQTLWMLTSFETFDALAGDDRPLIDAIPTVIDLVEAAVR